jgi:hypothetical protein
MHHLPPFLAEAHDPADPNPWLALYLDHSTPLPDEVKKAWLKDSASWSRQFLMPFARPLARVAIVLIQVVKVFMPSRFRAPRLLHWLLATGLKYFVSPEANWLILRHFHLGSDILAFIGGNAGVDVPGNPLRPQKIDDLKANLFLIHDLNLFNFVIHLNQALRARGQPLLTPPATLDFGMLRDCPLDIRDMPRRWCNVLDLQTAIEFFTPAYQLFLSDNDFWRATNSLQLDETIGLYAARLTGTPEHLVLLNNKHPLVPMSTLRAGYRLVLHGLSTEMLHSVLLEMKAAAGASHERDGAIGEVFTSSEDGRPAESMTS